MKRVASRHGGNRHALAAWLAATAALAAPSADAQMRNEALVTSQIDLIDSEYSQSRAMITWCDEAGGLWIADIDRETGQFVPSDGKGLLIDPDAMRLEDLEVVGNGPEWITTADGDQIVYTKFVSGLEHTTQNARLALAQHLQGGNWTYDYLWPMRRRNAPYASHDPGDPLPRISYVDPYGQHFWRNLHDPSETLLPMPTSRFSVRFVEGMRAVVYVAQVGGVSQLFHHALDTGITTQVTFDAGDKDLHSVPWSWQAPEFGDDLVIATLVDDTELRIYRQSDGAGWSLVHSIQTPQQGIINSPEPFEHNGKSYIVFSAAKPPYTAPTTIYMATIDPAEPMVVQLSPDWPARIRKDPEIFVTNSGPYIYFNRLQLSGQRYCTTCNEGVFRTYTGLPPAQE